MLDWEQELHTLPVHYMRGAVAISFDLSRGISGTTLIEATIVSCQYKHVDDHQHLLFNTSILELHNLLRSKGFEVKSYCIYLNLLFQSKE